MCEKQLNRVGGDGFCYAYDVVSLKVIHPKCVIAKNAKNQFYNTLIIKCNFLKTDQLQILIRQEG